MLELRTTNEILAILTFMITTWAGVYIVFGKHIKKKAIQNRFYTDDYGKENSMAAQIIKEEKDMNFLEKLQRDLDQARMKRSANSFIVFSILFAIVLATLGTIAFKNPIFAIILLGIGFIIPRFYIKGRRRRFIEEFDREMVKALRRMAAVLRVGGSLDQSLEDVMSSNTIPDIVKYEFGNVYAAYKAGFSINEAFYEIYKSVGSKDTLYLCVAMDIQMETGGDKSEIIDGIANQITEKNLKQRRVKSKLAEIDVSVKFMAMMPVIFGIIISFTNPDHFKFFTSSFFGQLTAFGIVSFMTGGYFLIKKLARIDM